MEAHLNMGYYGVGSGVPRRNGNCYICAYVSESGGIAARYAYTPFGEAMSQSGPLADTFRFRFSTKYQDAATGLYYYGYRFYDPQLARFLNRAPIEEQGGLNLYGFVGNDPVNKTDTLGLQVLPSSGRYFNTMDIAAVDW
jgi:RHS repeat-associated protein